MLGWYDHDRKRNDGMTVHLPLVLKAYFKCIEIKVGFATFLDKKLTGGLFSCTPDLLVISD